MDTDIVQFYNSNKRRIWITVILIPILVLSLGSIFFEELVWDSFIWRYLWGPVVADAEGEMVNGIEAGYNVVNTAVYGIILIISFFGIYELINHFEIKVDEKFVYSLLPWIFLGGSLRSLEDAGFFQEPFDRLMISPLIYFVLGFSVLILMAIGAYLSEQKLDVSKSKIYKVVLLFPIPLIYLFLSPYLKVFSVWFFLIIMVAVVLCFIISERYLRLDEKYLFFSYGLIFSFLAFSYNAHHLIFEENTRVVEIGLIFSLSVLVTLILVGVTWVKEDYVEREGQVGFYGILTDPLNLMICWAHLFDASSTFRGISRYDYHEKHVLPEFMIEIGGPWMIFVGKLALIILAIYVLDVMLKEELSENKELKVLLKFVIIVLGLAPGLRNTLRIAMAV